MCGSQPASGAGSPSSGKRQSDVCRACVSRLITASDPSQASPSPAPTSQSRRSRGERRMRGGGGGRARDRAGCRPRPGRPRASPRSRTARPASSMPRKATCSPSGDQATELHEPARRASSSGSPPRAGTAWTAGAASRSARSRGSAQNAMRVPSGDHAKLSTDQSPRVSRARPRTGARRLDVEVRGAIDGSPRRRGASRRA